MLPIFGYKRIFRRLSNCRLLGINGAAVSQCQVKCQPYTRDLLLQQREYKQQTRIHNKSKNDLNVFDSSNLSLYHSFTSLPFLSFCISIPQIPPTMPRPRRQIAISDDEDGYNEPPSPTLKREAHKNRSRASRRSITKSVTNGVSALEISPNIKTEVTVDVSSDEELDHEQENATPQKMPPEDATLLATPMMASTPVKVSTAAPKLQVAHLEPLAPTRKSFNDMVMPPPMKTSLHLPPPKQSFGDFSSTNDGLVAVSPSKGRLRSLAAEQAFHEKDLPPRPRLVISKLVLTNFKSYAGRQEIGPFHSVSYLGGFLSLTFAF